MSRKSSEEEVCEPLLIGWREWLSLPDLGIARIKAKVDTGAKTSTLHAYRIEEFEEHGQQKISFDIHPYQGSKKKTITSVADLWDVRQVMDSGGHREQRYVIMTTLVLGQMTWPIEVTLTNRDDLRFRMLLGRTAIRHNNLLLDPQASYLQGKPKRTHLHKVT